MPMLQVLASIATKGTMPRDVALVVSVTAEQASQYVPTISPGGSAGFAYWNDVGVPGATERKTGLRT